MIALYVAAAWWAAGMETALKTLAFCVLPFFCIWFPDAVGGWTGTRLDAPSITAQSPGCLVRALGWVLLFAPLIAYAILKWLV